MADIKQPARPDIETPAIELEGFDGLSLKIDVVNRPPTSWRRLENFDLFVPGSIRKCAPASKFSGPFPNVIGTPFEFKANDTAPRQLFGLGIDGKIYDLSNPATPGIDLGVGATNFPVFTALMPGVKIPFTFISWQVSRTVSVGQALISTAGDGNKYVFACTVPGTTGSKSAPTWPTSGTVVDGSVTWTNEGLAEDNLWSQNYLVIIVPGFQPIKFDGVAVTEIGISAPEVPLDIPSSLLLTTTDSTKGIQLSTGRYYSWTWWNPKTLHESAPAPVAANVPFYSLDADNLGSVQARGSFLKASPTNTYYSQIGLTIPQVVVENPPIGDDYTHVRFYATQDGGSQLFLLQTLYNQTGDIITDGNGAVQIVSMGTVQAYEAVSITQSRTTCVVAFDGISDGLGFSSQDTIQPGDDLITEGGVGNVKLVKGTLGVDPDEAAHIDNQAFFVMTTVQAANLGVNWSLEVRIRSQDTVFGGVIASFEDTQVGPPSIFSKSDRYMWMSPSGHVHFAFRDSITGTIVQLNVPSATANDGSPHVIDVRGVGSAGGVEIFYDGVSVAAVANQNNPQFAGFWRFGYGDILSRAAIVNKPASNYFTGTLDEIAWWATTSITSGQIANNAAQATTNGNYAAVIVALSPTDYYRLDDLSPLQEVPTVDAALVFPSPALTDNFPPPIARWGAVFQGSLFLQDYENANIITYSDAGFFESFGEFAFVQFQTPNDDDINSMIAGLNLLVVSTRREVDSISGPTPAQFTKSPIDSLHGFQGKRCVVSLGSTLVGQMKQGVTSLELSLSFGATGQNVQLGYGNGSLIGDDIQPITQTIPDTALELLACMTIDNNQNILLYAAGIPFYQDFLVCFNGAILLYSMGTRPGWSVLLPPFEVTTIKEVVFPGDTETGILACGSDSNVYRLFSNPGVASLAVAESQALPTRKQIGPEFWDTSKDFLYFYVEGDDLANFTYQSATDVSDFNTFVPAIPLQMRPGKNILNVSGKQIVLRFSHAVAPSDSCDAPLISYVKIVYTIRGRRS